jgi:hypothetical protein
VLQTKTSLISMLSKDIVQLQRIKTLVQECNLDQTILLSILLMAIKD